MHWPHFSKDLMSIHVWRQTQTQSTIDNFYEEDMNLFHPTRNDRGSTDGTFRMEFPLMQWLVAGLYQLFGKHLIISRIAMFVIGLFSILGMYQLLLALFGSTTLALIGAWAFNFSPSFFYYTINPLPDNFALCCGLWGLALFFTWLKHPKRFYLLLSGLFLSLSALCKLPFIIYYSVPGVYFLWQLIKNGYSKQWLLNGLSVLLLVVLPLAWYITVIPEWEGNPVVKGMLQNEASSSKLLYYLQYNLISTLPELLLNYGAVPFFVASFYYLYRKKAYQDARFIPIVSLCVAALIYYLFEANTIAKIHDYYLFPFFPVLFMLVAYGAFNMLQAKSKASRYVSLLLLAILPITCYLRMESRWNPEAPGFNKDLLVHKVALQNAVPKNALVVAGNDKSHFIFFYYIDKKGWGFHDNSLSPSQLQQMISEGAQYLYTDATAIYQNRAFAPYLDTLITQQGSVRIYGLRAIKK